MIKGGTSTKRIKKFASFLIQKHGYPMFPVTSLLIGIDYDESRWFNYENFIGCVYAFKEFAVIRNQTRNLVSVHRTFRAASILRQERN